MEFHQYYYCNSVRYLFIDAYVETSSIIIHYYLILKRVETWVEMYEKNKILNKLFVRILRYFHI